ncbi:MAG: hypothetical protein WCI39_05570 [Gallionellaceae bacterium]
MQIKFISTSSNQPVGLLRKIVAIVLTIALVAVALMFSAILLTAIFILVLVGGTYLWWKTREIRKHLKTFSQQAASMRGDAFTEAASQGEVIEGEVIHVDKSFSAKRVS